MARPNARQAVRHGGGPSSLVPNGDATMVRACSLVVCRVAQRAVIAFCGWTARRRPGLIRTASGTERHDCQKPDDQHCSATYAARAAVTARSLRGTGMFPDRTND